MASDAPPPSSPDGFDLLCRVARGCVAVREYSELTQLIPRAAVEVLAADLAVLCLTDPGGVTEVVGSAGEASPGAPEVGAWLTERIREIRRAVRLPGAAFPGGVAGGFLVVPLSHGRELFGSLGCYRLGGPFDEAEQAALAALAAQAAPILDRARRLVTAEQQATEVAAVQEIGRAISSRLELGAVLEAVVAGAATLLGCQHAQITLWDESRQTLIYGAAIGPEAARVRSQQFGFDRGVNGATARSRAPHLLNHYQASPYALPEYPDVVATVTVPVLFEERLLGVLHSHTTERGRRFTPIDLRRLELLATQAAIAIEHARLVAERERLAAAELVRLRRLSVVGAIGAAMQGSMRLEGLLRIILTGVTVGQGMGFNRALLLLVDEAQGLLVGRMGVGPDSGEEAARIWGRLDAAAHPLTDIAAARQAEAEGGEASSFDRMARSLRISLQPEAGVLARTALEARPFRVRRGDPEWAEEGKAWLEVEEFASVPLVAKGRAIGVLVVDNKFTGKPISDVDLEFLGILAQQAGAAVESAQVHARLEAALREVRQSHHQLLAQERLATLGEMVAHTVHEVRNPLVAIGGFARRLEARLAGSKREGDYARLIAREVSRLEKILGDVQLFSREAPLRPVELDLAGGIRDCLDLVGELAARQGVGLELAMETDPLRLRADPVRLKQALLNLLANALEAMPGGGVLRVASRRVPAGAAGEAEGEGSGPAPAEGWIVVEVIDSGAGIDEAVRAKLFEPFFTTKESGTGLGLPVVRRIMQAHGGRVQMTSRPEGGALFALWFPHPGPREETSP